MKMAYLKLRNNEWKIETVILCLSYIYAYTSLLQHHELNAYVELESIL